MLIKFLLTLLFLVFVWWFFRFSQRSGYRGTLLEQETNEYDRRNINPKAEQTD